MSNRPRIIIGATGSNSGKTTLVSGLLRALQMKNLKPMAYKCGPDYIDPMFHKEAIKVPSRNLDLFFTNEDIVKHLIRKNSEFADISIIEGVMGYYDGLSMSSSEASAYDIATKTNTPAVVIFDGRGKASSILADIYGYLAIKKDSKIKGVIINRVSEGVYSFMKEMIEKEFEEYGIKVYGYLPKLVDCNLESRHLGLITAEEIENLQEILDKLGAQILKSIDVDGLVALANEAESIEEISIELPNKELKENIKIAVAKDKAFNFYYEDNLDLLRCYGAEIVFFSPINDKKLPDGINGIILGGGYPELYLNELSSNKEMIDSINSYINKDIPLIAECGGFMYLHKQIKDKEGKAYDVVGAIDTVCECKNKLVRFGYASFEAQGNNLLLDKGESIRGHEFHIWDSADNGNGLIATKPSSKRSWECAHYNENSLCGYPHLYFYSNPNAPKNFMNKALKFSQKSID